MLMTKLATTPSLLQPIIERANELAWGHCVHGSVLQIVGGNKMTVEHDNEL
jgi:hypothetical protein